MAGEIPEGQVAIARISGAWGTRGDLKAEPLAPPEVLVEGREVTVSGRRTRLSRVMSSGSRIRLHLAGIDEREAAAALRDQYVLVAEASLPALPEDQYYRFQLLGLTVVTKEGDQLGTVEDVFSTPENDVYVVRGDGREVLLPATDDVVLEIDLAARTMTVELIPGLLA
jgi:16S rRNA processing protein RimM